MYHPVNIEQLSKSQISRLLNGHSVRVKHGNKHTVHLSKEQHKKHIKAHAKGSGFNLSFDPYQMHQHSHLRGQGLREELNKVPHGAKKIYNESFAPMINQGMHNFKNMVSHPSLRGGGFLDVINDIGHKAGSAFSMGNNIPFNPYDLGFQLGHDVIAPALMKGKGIKKGHKLHGKGFLDDVGRAFDSRQMKTVLKFAEPYAEKALNKAGEMAINYAMKGEGLHKRRGRPAHKKHGGALYPAGYGY